MIATILPSVNGFPGILYNERKVLQGKAVLLEMSGFGNEWDNRIPAPDDLIDYLEEYSSQNTRIKKPQFHLVLSCKGNEMNNRQLLEFAHDYLKEMGYGAPEQPILIYAHQDTDNNHLHIITSRVAPDGTKIEHDNERICSQQVLNKLQGENARIKADEALQIALSFNFRSETQFKAILEAMNYECFEKESQIMIKKGGVVQTVISKQELQSYIRRNINFYQEPNYNQLKGIFSKYRDLNTDIRGLKEDLHKKFGIDLVFFGRKDSPYGYAAVDFRNKRVIEGSKILSVKQLLDFSSEEEHFNSIENFIDQCFQNNSDLTTQELNKLLKRMNARIKKDEIIFRNQKKKLSNLIANSLSINNKIAWINTFNPKSRQELNLLGSLCGLDNRNISNIKINTNISYTRTQIQLISNLRNMNDPQSRYQHLRTEGYRIINTGKGTFAYNPQKHSILDLDILKIKILNPIQMKQNIDETLEKRTGKIKGKVSSESGSGVNREWEVGTKKGWDEESGKQMSY